MMKAIVLVFATGDQMAASGVTAHDLRDEVTNDLVETQYFGDQVDVKILHAEDDQLFFERLIDRLATD